MTANAVPTHHAATTIPASGARAICAVTPVVQSAVLAVMSSSPSTTSGTSDAAAGLNSSDAVDRPNATANAVAVEVWATRSTNPSPARARSGAIMMDRRGYRSATTPATGRSRKTGATSKATVVATPRPEPEHEHDQGDGVEGVTGARDAVGQEDSAEVGAPTKQGKHGRRSGWSDEVADALGVAVRRVEVLRALDEPLELSLEDAQVSDRPRDLV